MQRREFLAAAAAIPAAATVSTPVRGAAPADAAKFRRIAVEEAWMPAELVTEWRGVIARNPAVEAAFSRFSSGFLSDRPAAKQRMAELAEIGDGRIRAMDDAGIAKQVFSINSPGVQPLEDDRAIGMSVLLNDMAAEAVRKNPTRLDAFATVAPQGPAAAVKEIQRAVTKLGMKGVLINSHTRGEFLDDQKFWPIFEAVEALGTTLYIHPREPAPAMVAPYQSYGLDSAMWGFAAETSLHIMRIIMAGVFDRFPRLNLMIGHGGEGIPYFLDRIDDRYKASQGIFGNRAVGGLQRKPSDYFRERIYVTTSGMNFRSPLMFLINEMGADRVLYAADYPHESMQTRLAVDALPLTDEVKVKVFGGNATRVLGLT